MNAQPFIFPVVSRRAACIRPPWHVLTLLMIVACAPVEKTAEPAVHVFPPPPEQPRYYYERTLTGSGDVQEDTATDRFRRFATGERRSGRGFAKPFDVVARDGRVFVGDTVSRRVAVLDFPRKRYYEIGTSGVGRLAKPLGMALDGAGQLYVCDGTTKRIMIYDADGAFLRSIGSDEVFSRPSGVAVNTDGTRIYVVDTGGVSEDQHRVYIFDERGTVLGKIGDRGKESGQFNLPLNAAVGPDGTLYVVDTGNFRVQAFSPEGEFRFSFGRAGRVPGSFSHPKGIAVDDTGKIFVADTGFGNLQIFNEKGQLLLFIGERSERGGPAQYILPAGISVDVDGRIYIVDQFFRKVDVYRPAELPEGSVVGLPPVSRR